MILVDTHVMVWLAFEPHRVSPKARAAIDSTRAEGEGLAISDMSLLELTMLVGKGRIQLAASLESFFREIEALFVVLPIRGHACLLALGLPDDFPNDPGDRIIAATAASEGIPLVTADREIRRSKAIKTIW